MTHAGIKGGTNRGELAPMIQKFPIPDRVVRLIILFTLLLSEPVTRSNKSFQHLAPPTPEVTDGKGVEIRPDIAQEFPELFGNLQVNGRALNVREVIATLTTQFAPEFSKRLHDRSEFLRQIEEGEAFYGFAQPSQEFTDVDGNKRTAAQIRQGLVDNLFNNGTEEQWELNEEIPIPLRTKRPGLQGTGPANDMGMAMGALNAGAYGAVSWMWDWEDAGNDYQTRLYEAWRNLKIILEGTWEEGRVFNHPTKKKPYSIQIPRDQWPVIFHRVPSIHLKNRQISMNGEGVPAIIPALVIHTLHNYDSLTRHHSGVYFYIPKIETPEEALLVAQLLDALEETIGVGRGTIKIEMLNERARYAANQEIILWTLRHWLIGPNVGRWDYLNSIIEMFKDAPEGVFPDPHTITMTADFMTEYTRRNATLAAMADGFSIGGMSAVMKIRTPPTGFKFDVDTVNRNALRSVWFDKLRERLTGLLKFEGVDQEFDMYRQSWVATTEPDYVIAGAIPLVTDRENLQKLVDGKLSDAEIDAILGQMDEGLPDKEREQIRELFRELNQAERTRLQALGLLNENSKITPYQVTQSYLDHLYSSQAWERLFKVPQGKVTEKGLRYAIYMAAEYMFQQIQGNNAAAVDDYLTGNRLMNDFATYEIFWHWLWTAVHHEVNYEAADGTTQKLTWDTMKKFLDEHADNSEEKINDLIARDEEEGTKKFQFERRWAPIVVELLERQLKNPRWIQYGSRVLLSIVNAAEKTENYEDLADQVMNIVSSDSREEVVERVNSGEWPRNALQIYDYVYDIFPEEDEINAGSRGVVSAL